MYNSPPPVDCLNWSFGLMFDICLKIGLGKNGVGRSSWTIPKLVDQKNLPISESAMRGWKSGTGIKPTGLNHLVDALTKGEEYGEQWEAVIRNSVRYKLKTDGIQKQRKDYFNVSEFPNDEKQTDDLINAYFSKAQVLSSVEQIHQILDQQRPKPVVHNTTETIKPVEKTPVEKAFPFNLGNKALLLIPVVLTASVLTYSMNKEKEFDYRDLNLKKLVFNNIQFCSEPNFDHDLNKCLAKASVFKKRIEKVNISFESDVLPEDARFNMRWYRYGEKFAESTKNWTETFAHDLKYASTFIGSNKGMDSGLYQVRFYMKDDIIGEAQFEIEK